MSNQMINNLTYLKLLEASRIAFESSEKALKAAEEAFKSAKIVNVDAKAALDAATEAFNTASYKTSENEKPLTSRKSSMFVGRDSQQEIADPDEAEEGIIMLSTKKDPVIHLKDDIILISSSGPAADHQGDMLGLYRRTEQMEEGRSVYKQEKDRQYGDSFCKLFSHKGVWMVTDGNTECLRAATTSESPTSAKWQYIDYDYDYEHEHEHDYDKWRDDPTLTVTGLGEKPIDCEVTISLSQSVETDILEGYTWS